MSGLAFRGKPIRAKAAAEFQRIFRDREAPVDEPSGPERRSVRRVAGKGAQEDVEHDDVQGGQGHTGHHVAFQFAVKVEPIRRVSPGDDQAASVTIQPRLRF